MTVVKLSISLDPDLAAEVREAAERSGTSVSAWAADALQTRLRQQGLKELLEEWQAEHGAFTQQELDEADREIGLALKRARQRPT